MFPTLSEQRIGEVAVLLSALLWALFPAITVLSIASVPPILSAGLSTLAACSWFAVVLMWKRAWRWQWPKAVWRDVLIGTCVNGIAFHGIVFWALQYTSAGNAALVMQLETLFAFFILSVLIKHETFRWHQFAGALLIIAGAALVLAPQASDGWQQGDWAIIVACAIAPVGNFFQQRACRQIPVESLLLVRSILAGSFMIVLGCWFESMPTHADLLNALPVIVLNGLVLLGISKVLWFEGFVRIPITKANALAAVMPFFALGFAYVLLGEIPTVWQLIAVIPIAVGMIVLMWRRS